MPAQLAVPVAAEVHVKGNRAACMAIAGFIPGNVATMLMTRQSADCDLRAQQPIGRLVSLPCSQLTILQLDIFNWRPGSHMHVHGGLLSLEALTVRSQRNLCISIGPTVQLKTLSLSVGWQLNLGLQNAQRAVARLASLHASFQHSHGQGNSELMSAMQQREATPSSAASESGETCIAYPPGAAAAPSRSPLHGVPVLPDHHGGVPAFQAPQGV